MASFKSAKIDVEVETEDGRRFRYVKTEDGDLSCKGCAFFRAENSVYCTALICIGGIYKEVKSETKKG